MKTSFFGTGNIGADPIVRDVPATDGKDASRVINLRVFFDRTKASDSGEREDNGGFWADVSLFGKRADKLHSLLQNKARIAVYGAMHMGYFGDDNKQVVKITASFIGPDPIGIEDITFRKSARAA